MPSRRCIYASSQPGWNDSEMRSTLPRMTPSQALRPVQSRPNGEVLCGLLAASCA